MKYRVEIKDRDGNWLPIHPTGGPPYEWPTRLEAEQNARMCYPEEFRLTGEDRGVRVVEVTP